MKTDPQETRLGAIWFFIAGPVAICLVIFLASFDHNKTMYGHEQEQEHADMLKEIRIAQASMGGEMLDPRIKSKVSAKAEEPESTDHDLNHVTEEVPAHH